jgi:hypothetical protein
MVWRSKRVRISWVVFCLVVGGGIPLWSYIQGEIDKGWLVFSLFGPLALLGLFPTEKQAKGRRRQK